MSHGGQGLAMPEWLPLRNRAQSMGISPGDFRKLFVVVVFYFIFLLVTSFVISICSILIKAMKTRLRLLNYFIQGSEKLCIYKTCQSMDAWNTLCSILGVFLW